MASAEDEFTERGKYLSLERQIEVDYGGTCEPGWQRCKCRQKGGDRLKAAEVN